ncbi:MAG: acetyl-CoA carboxylase carboxyl transferase subunit beta, partial [Treponema sp.]|nr:acetyl-CoA carboxylase carboxyl transferase subunit beta [Treponema sp.]
MSDYTCSNCQKPVPNAEANLWVCGDCGNHSRLGWQQRLGITADNGTFSEFDSGMKSGNPIDFP